MRNDLIPEGATLLAVALLTRGWATRPRALVAYRTPKSYGREYTTQEVCLDSFPAFRTSGHYVLATDMNALVDFGARLERDLESYSKVPLTEPDWLNVSSWSEVLDAYEEGRVLMPDYTHEELLEKAEADELRQLAEDEASERFLHETPGEA